MIKSIGINKIKTSLAGHSKAVKAQTSSDLSFGFGTLRRAPSEDLELHEGSWGQHVC